MCNPAPKIEKAIPESAKYPGYDMRPDIRESNLLKTKLGEYIWKMKILDALMDPDKSIHEKMRVYDSLYLPNQVAQSNVLSGGVFRDWNFDF